MANFGQLLAGAGRVSQGMESARAIRQANEARAQQLQTNRMRLEELRRLEGERVRKLQLPSTIGDISFGPGDYEGMPTYEVPEQAPAPTTTAPTPTTAGIKIPTVTSGVTTPTAGVKTTTLLPPPNRKLTKKEQEIETALQRGAKVTDLETILDGDEEGLAYLRSRIKEPTKAEIPYGEEFGSTPTAAPAKGQMTREKFLSLSPEVQQQYLQREADIRGFGTWPAIAADLFLGMPTEYAGRAAEAFAESRVGRALGLTQPGEEAYYRGLTGGTTQPFEQALIRATPITVADYIESLPTDAEVQGIPSDTTQAEPPEPPPEQPPMEAEEEMPSLTVAGIDVGTKKDPIESIAKGRPRSFQADPTKYTPALAQGMRNREYLRQLATVYRQSGSPDKAFEVEARIQSLDTDLYKLAADQAITEFQYGGDPARMMNLIQQLSNVPMDIQYRTDGLYNVYVNGNMQEQPLDVISLTDVLRTFADDAYRIKKTDAQLENQKEILKSQLETDKEIMKARAQMVREAAIAQINGQYNLAKEQLNQRGYAITNLNDGRVVISAKDGSQIAMVDLNNNTVTVDGVEIPVAPQVQPFQFQ